jgi:hypothetical protein
MPAKKSVLIERFQRTELEERISMKKDFINTIKYPFPDDSRLKKVKFIVFDGEAVDFWKEYHNLCHCEQDCMGLTFQYADFGKSKPCWASLFFYTVDGIFTAFVDAHGAYVDHFKLEAYVFAMCGMKMNPDNHCNGINTHNHPAVWAASNERRFRKLQLDLAESNQQLIMTYYR